MRASRLALVAALLMLPGCGVWKAQRRLAPMDGQETTRPPGSGDRDGAELLFVDPDPSVVDAGDVEVEAGRRVRVTVVARGHEPPVVLAVGMTFVPVVPLFLATVPAQLIVPPHRGEVEVIIEIAAVTSGLRPQPLLPVALEDGPPRADDVEISLHEGFHRERAIRARLAPEDVALSRDGVLLPPSDFTSVISPAGCVRFRAVFHVVDCASPCEVLVRKLRVSGQVFDLPPVRFGPQTIIGVWF